ncbi:hypothetical protein BJX64DRAFT_273132 [Aspergillus heterothallicus]
MWSPSPGAVPTSGAVPPHTAATLAHDWRRQSSELWIPNFFYKNFLKKVETSP